MVTEALGITGFTLNTPYAKTGNISKAGFVESVYHVRCVAFRNVPNLKKSIAHTKSPGVWKIAWGSGGGR